jgi:peptidoglycan/LPS O-acetylase OafA/YrhL
MTSVLRETLRSLRASPVFAFYVLVALGVGAFNGWMVFLMWLGVPLPGGFGQMTHGTIEAHRTHDLTFAFLFVPAVIGLLVQLWRPAKNVAGQVMALIPWAALVLTVALTFVLTDSARRGFNPAWRGVAMVAVIAALLHPTGRGFFRSFRVSRVNWVTLALVGIAAVPLLVFAFTNVVLQGTVADEHAFLGHYGFMAAFSFTVIGLGLVASLRADGWRLTVWVTGLLPVLLGLTSLIYPHSSSSLASVWALAAIAWGVGFVAAAERTRHTDGLTLPGSRRVLSRSAPD